MKKRHCILLLLLGCMCTAPANSDHAAPQNVVRIVDQIRKADYEGNRAALKQLQEQLAPYAEDKEIGSRVSYWAGFALWRRAINGFNEESIEPKELEQDLTLAIQDFRKSSAQDPEFIEPKIGIFSCTGYLVYMTVNAGNKERAKELIAEVTPLKNEMLATDPDNPRLLWTLGPTFWRIPVEGQGKAIATYLKALETIRNPGNAKANDPLAPSWGEPELLMNLAWSYLNQTQPDLKAAEKNARAALEFVPYWHYVRDILMPQIHEAKAKAESGRAN